MAVASVVAVVCSGRRGPAECAGTGPGRGVAGAGSRRADDVAPTGKVSSKPEIVRAAVANRPGVGYRNPLRGVNGLVPERIDEGVDFAGTGPVYALGDAIVTSAAGTNYGWPGGGWITYRLTSGPGVGLVVYVAEDITPAVVAGQRVSSSTVLGTMFDGGDGIETGWAQPTGLSAESQLPQAGAIPAGSVRSRPGWGANFDELLQSAGGACRAQPRPNPLMGFSLTGYPASWR